MSAIFNLLFVIFTFLLLGESFVHSPNLRLRITSWASIADRNELVLIVYIIYLFKV